MSAIKSMKQLCIALSHSCKEKIWRISWNKFSNNRGNFVGMICCTDGKVWHGGLTDRFKGIISTYLFCKVNNIPFRINYTYPFNLKKYLEPNEYDWTIKENEFSENPITTRILYLIAEPSYFRFHRPHRTQIHVYANRDIIKKLDKKADWGTLFRELFKPSPLLEENLAKLEFGKYIALVFRFQNLIGDFPEYQFQPMDEQHQETLLLKCENSIREMRNRFPNHNLLITSDSFTFLNRVSHFDNVKIIPGEIVHIDNNNAGDCEHAHLKSFIDFFMISKAERVYCIGTKEMYPSEFPMYAAKLNNIPFERILI